MATVLGRIANLADGLFSGSAVVKHLPESVVDMTARGIGAASRAFRSTVTRAPEARARGVLIGARVGAERLVIYRNGNLEGLDKMRFGESVTLYDGVSLYADGDRAGISIGAETHLGSQTIIFGGGGVTIGAGCAIAARVIVYSTTNRMDVDPRARIIDQGARYAAVTIGDDVWIGAAAVILPGVTIGSHAVIAAGAVVNRDVAPWQVVGGVPAKVLKDRRGDVAAQ